MCYIAQIVQIIFRLRVAMMSGQLEIPVGYSEQLTSRLMELPLLDRYWLFPLVL